MEISFADVKNDKEKERKGKMANFISNDEEKDFFDGLSNKLNKSKTKVYMNFSLVGLKDIGDYVDKAIEVRERYPEYDFEIEIGC